MTEQRTPYTKTDDGRGYTPVTAMQEISQHMDIAAWNVLIALLNWGKLWEDLHAGNASFSKDNDDYIFVMMAPLTGMGGNIMGWQYYGPSVMSILMDITTQWCADEVYRASNPMPWSILTRCAPALSARSTTWENSHEVVRIIGRTFTNKTQVPEVDHHELQTSQRQDDQPNGYEQRGGRPPEFAHNTNPTKSTSPTNPGQAGGARLGSVIRR